MIKKINATVLMQTSRTISYIRYIPLLLPFHTNGKNWPVYNQGLGRQSHSSKMAKITLVGLPHWTLNMRLPAKWCGSWLFRSLLVLLEWPFIPC